MIHEIENTVLVLSDERLSFELTHKEHIDVYWDQVFEANQRLWNGLYFMFSNVLIEDGVLSATAHRTDFATFLYWREHGRHKSVTHITGTAFPAMDDNSLLAVEMSRHTANPGRIYFPAGSFDKDDIVDGHLDPVRNFTREMNEEVGIEVEQDWLVGPLLAAEADNSFHITRKVQLPMDFPKVEKHWRKHRADGGDDEVAALVRFENAGHIPSQMPQYAQELCRYHFSMLAK